MKIQFKQYFIPFKSDYVESKDVAAIEIDHTSRTVNITSLDSVLYVIPFESVQFTSEQIPQQKVKTRTRKTSE
jgi:hypothetical protein